MRAKQVVLFTVVCIVLCWITAGKAQVQEQKAPARLYNTAKEKLMEGKQIVGATVFSPDRILLRHGERRLRFPVDRDAAQPPYIWDVARMIWLQGGSRDAFIRVPTRRERYPESDGHRAVGIIVPTVDTWRRLSSGEVVQVSA